MHGVFGVDHVVRQHHGERFRAHQFPRAQHRVAQAERLLLPDVGHVDHVGDLRTMASSSFLPRVSSMFSSSKLTSK